jgi:hypothetical protein
MRNQFLQKPQKIRLIAIPFNYIFKIQAGGHSEEAAGDPVVRSGRGASAFRQSADFFQRSADFRQSADCQQSAECQRAEDRRECWEGGDKQQRLQHSYHLAITHCNQSLSFNNNLQTHFLIIIVQLKG